jgi:FtsH-binding integral membrane protein
MEDDAKEFLNKVVRTLTIALLWLMINMTLGIYNRFLIFEDGPTIGNIIFYIWMIISLVLLIWLNYKIWKQPSKAIDKEDN